LITAIGSLCAPLPRLEKVARKEKHKFVFPGAGALWIAWMIGAYALLFGLAMFAVAVRLRHWARGRTVRRT
jgi:hypothetical protein